MNTVRTLKLEEMNELAAKDALIGIYAVESNQAYHQAPGLSSTGIKELLRSPAHYKHMLEKLDAKQTRALFLGEAHHCCTLEYERFQREYARLPSPQDYPNALFTTEDIRKRAAELELKLPSKAKKEELVAALLEADPTAQVWEKIAQEASNSGKIMLSAEDWDLIMGMRESVLAHPKAALLIQGHIEVAAFAKDPKTGVLRKAKADSLLPNGIIADLKSCEDASRRAFMRQIGNYDYHVSAAYYLDTFCMAIEQARERSFTDSLEVEPPTLWAFIATEREEPRGTIVYDLAPEGFASGRAAVDFALSRYQECEKTNKWTSYSDEILTIGVPGWWNLQDLTG